MAAGAMGVMSGVSAVLVAALAGMTEAQLASGVVRPQTPPMGWRSWNYFACNISQALMEGQVDALKKQWAFDKDLPTASLFDLGYSHVGLDDCWQDCISPKAGFHDPKTGMAMINTTRFPDMGGMVRYGTERNVTMGFYMNNCRCHEKTPPTHYPEDAKLTEELGWGGIKIDSCGDQRDMAEWAEQFAANGRDLLVESCGNGPNGTNPKKDTPPMQAFMDQVETTCPFSFFRVSEDAAPQFNSIVYNANRAVPYLTSKPLSRPGCWAYADMLEVGVAPMTHTESRVHFAIYAIISSPLILGFDMSDESVLSSVWDIISNPETLNVSQSWQADVPFASGRLVRNSTKFFMATVKHGYAGIRTSQELLPDYQVWSKPLSMTSVAVLVVNNAETETDITFSLAELGLPSKVFVRDIWARTDKGTLAGSFKATLPSHEGVFLKLTA
eukprot:CAMPEP_0206293884 /NCGR_PEP_ID=MMETSP0106_2-20121207/4365_1 /ASSEMBLY_ACC=CAM_ASM_000206 /TAXON_ID=81532 /ORGANISM="Acanthoeca-like sp., Strain 10tr" /LENGTH=441 /DNA_ID=CAMNT_0053724489 /DNA_START=8 /DNA_END=1333 /DNA_ORIENTATION=+